MAWTLIMLAIAFGMSASAFIGWRQERREEDAPDSEGAPASEKDGTGRHMAAFADFAHAGHA